jgi:hypothetical protein
MDEKDFKKHLRDLAHGHHHPEEHDWAADTKVRVTAQPSGKAKKAAPKAKRPKRASRT